MDIASIVQLSQKPRPFAKSSAPFWSDPHISKGLLQAHLDAEWDAASRKHSTIKTSVDWLCNEILPPPPASILDLGCGPGLYCAPLAQRGYRAMGIDLSSRSLHYARERAAREGLAIEYLEQDYLTMEYFEQFQAALLIYCDFCVLPPKSRALLLKKIRRSLSPGGLFLFDVFTPNQRKEEPQTPVWEAKDKGFWSSEPHLLLDHSFYYQREEMYVNQVICIKQEKTDIYRFWEQYFTPERIRIELQESGFKEIHIYANIVGDIYTKESKTMAIVARS